jgi:hypothetical protein
MSATDAQVARVKRLCVIEAEDTVYDDDTVQECIEQYPKLDSEGRDSEDDEWDEDYDLFAAAADICEEKAATFAGKYDFSADGGTFSASQQFDHWSRLASRYRSRRAARTIHLVPSRPYVQEIAKGEVPVELDIWESIDELDEGVRTEDIPI